MRNAYLLKFLYLFFLGTIFFPILPTSFSVTTDGQTLTLDGDYFLGAGASSFIGVYSSITITNSTGATRTATLDGAGHTVYFPYNTASSSFQFTGDGVVLTVQNVNFQGYDPAAVSYASANAKIIFGDNTKIVFERDLSILYTDRTWTCSGNVLLDGQNLTLTASGDSALSMQGAGKTLTIKNTILKPQGPDSICCLDGASKIALSNSTLELGRDGLAVNNGYIDIDGKVQVRGIDISYTGTPSLAALTTRYKNLGFSLWFPTHTNPAFYNITLSDAYSGNLNSFTQARITTENKAYYSTSTDQYNIGWVEILPSAVYKSIDIGTDGQMWVIKTDQSVHRVTRGAPPTLSAASNVTGDYIAVGGANYVFVLNNSTGLVYQCNNPTGTPNSWSAVPGIYFPRGIAAGSDGTLWFVALDGRVYKKSYQSDKIEQIFDGIDRDVVKISASGTVDYNCVALLSSIPKDGRVLVSQSGGPFRDLGINQVVDVGIGSKGSIMLAFDGSIVTADATFGLPIYSKINTSMPQILTMDRTLTFSSDKYLTIKSGAELEMTNDTAIRYQPNDFLASYYQRRHLVFQDYSSTLKLNRSILDIGLYGLTFSNGNMVVDGSNWIYCNPQYSRELEILSDFNISMRSGSQINYMGPIDFVDRDVAIQPPYYSVSGVSASTMKSGVSDSVTLQAISDAYAAGFVAPGSASTHWQYRYIGIIDTFGVYTNIPTIVGTNSADKRAQIGLNNSGSYATYTGDSGTGIDIGVDGSLEINGWGGDQANIIWPVIGTGANQNSGVLCVGLVNVICTVAWSASVGGQVYSNAASVQVNLSPRPQTFPVAAGSAFPTILGYSRLIKPVAVGTDGTLWYVERPSGSIRKRVNGVESIITLPSNISGTVFAISAKGTATSSYLAIASTTGQAYYKKNDDPWIDLNLTGVVDISIGVRGSIVVLIKQSPTWTAHGALARPGF